jgi:rare lipoprotein A
MRRITLAALASLFVTTHAGAAETLASWYHEGQLTATGERFRPDGLTAAHRSLPFGTKLRVTSKATGRSVVVRVNDRGPALWTGRGLDLSRGAASVLGMIRAGLARVAWVVVN